MNQSYRYHPEADYFSNDVAKCFIPQIKKVLLYVQFKELDMQHFHLFTDTIEVVEHLCSKLDPVSCFTGKLARCSEVLKLETSSFFLTLHKHISPHRNLISCQ